MNAERATKLRKLQKLRAETPYVSKSGLEGILDHLRKHGLPDLTLAKHMREANRQIIQEATGYGKLLNHKNLTTIDGGTISIGFLNIFSFLHYAFKQGGALYHAMKPMQGPLGLIFYTDEVVCGNPLAHSPRKFWVCYCAMKQSGKLLQNEDSWVTIFCVRSSIVSQLDGNLSQLMKEVLVDIFCNTSIDCQHLGVLLQGPDQDLHRYTFQLDSFIQDGGAHKYVWSTRGDAACRFCFLCRNIFGGKGEDDIDPVSLFTSEAQLVATTSEEIFASWDRMAQRHNTCSAQEFKLRSVPSGITFSPHAILAESSLRTILDPIKQFRHDWMHALVSNGILNLGVYLLLTTTKLWDSFASYVAKWSAPFQFAGVNIAALFDTKKIEKHKKSEKLNATASELLTLLPVLCHYIQKVCRDQFMSEAKAVIAFSHLVELMQSTWSGCVTASMIRDCAEEALGYWLKCGWPVMRKHHWILHFARSYSLHGEALSCFTMERKNKMISRFSTPMENTKFFEQGIFEEVVNYELVALTKEGTFDMKPQLLKPVAWPKKLGPLATSIWPGLDVRQLKCSQSAQYDNGTTHGVCGKGDFVLLAMAGNQRSCGQIQCFVSIFDGAQLFALVDLFTLKEACSTYAVWTESGKENVFVVPLGHILSAVTFAKGNGTVTTLTPLCWR